MLIPGLQETNHILGESFVQNTSSSGGPRRLSVGLGTSVAALPKIFRKALCNERTILPIFINGNGFLMSNHHPEINLSPEMEVLLKIAGVFTNSLGRLSSRLGRSHPNPDTVAGGERRVLILSTEWRRHCDRSKHQRQRRHRHSFQFSE